MLSHIWHTKAKCWSLRISRKTSHLMYYSLCLNGTFSWALPQLVMSLSVLKKFKLIVSKSLPSSTPALIISRKCLHFVIYKTLRIKCYQPVTVSCILFSDLPKLLFILGLYAIICLRILLFPISSVNCIITESVDF